MKPIEKLEHKAYNIRVNSLKSTTAAGSGHPTSALSAADMVAALFFYAMKFDVNNPNAPNNDRFILSKGHAVPVLYAAYKELGVLAEEQTLDLRKFNSVLEGHPSARFAYTEAATGSLGQGLSIGVGMALGARMDKRDFYTYVMMGDSEVSEGSVWEACELAAHYKLNNLIALLDCNRLGQAGQTMAGHDLEYHSKRFATFGWKTFEVDGHNITEIVQALDAARQVKDQPSIIIARTFKGYGLDDIQDKNGWHGKAFSKEQLPALLKNLEKNFPQAAAYKDEETIAVSKDININADKVRYKHRKIEIPKPEYKLGENLATRKAYGQALVALGNQEDKAGENDIVVLDAEVKNSTFSMGFEKEFPENFFECYIAEQNMIGMATGLTMRDKIVFSSTFGAFLTRAADQIRMAAIGKVPLRIAGSHAGVSIGADGPSQMGLEDIAFFRTLCDSIVLYPSDAVSTYKLTELMANYTDGISYIRTTRADTPVIYDNAEQFVLGGFKVVRDYPQADALIIAAGITLFEAIKAHDQLADQGIKIIVLDLYCIKPLNAEKIYDVARRAGNKVITVEDHYKAGGIGEAIAAALINKQIRFKSLAVDLLPRSGEPEELLAYESIDSNAIVDAIEEIS